MADKERKVTIDLDTSYAKEDPEAKAFVKDMKKRGIGAHYPRDGQLLLTGTPEKLYNFLLEIEWFGPKPDTVGEIQELYPELLYGSWVDTKLLRKTKVVWSRFSSIMD